MKNFLISITFFLCLNAAAREGMWLPQLLKELNESDMKSMGMVISADDIYSINHSGLKDAVLQFGGGCTGELISPNGLLITNYHCGFSQIQSFSTIEKNYLEEGFWSMNYQEEIPCPGLTVTFVREITDVTASVLNGVKDSMNDDLRSAVIKTNSDSIEKSVTGNFKGIVRSFYQGNKFYLFKTEVFNDVRFVGAPPRLIGKFGGETDNWVWPRHTGDFSLFRIYSDKENHPAAYSKDNVPYKPKQFLTINIKGVNENDFVFVMGFPGRTSEYLFSSALDLIAVQTNPNRIALREIRLNNWRDAMSKNDTVRLQYSAKFSTLENSYKKWKGELSGFSHFNVIAKKKIAEDNFNKAIKNIPSIISDTSLISNYNKLNLAFSKLSYVNDYYAEGLSGIELINASARLKTLVTLCAGKKNDAKLISEEVNKTKNDFRLFYKNYNVAADEKICSEILKLTYSRLDKNYLPNSIAEAGNLSNDFSEYSSILFKKSLVADSNRLMKFLSSFKKNNVSKIINDPAYKLYLNITEIQQKLQADLAKKNKELMSIQRIYMRDLMEIDTTKKLFADANSTLRISYGKVEGTSPADGMKYTFLTTGDGILEKSGTDNTDYKIPPRLATLIKNKDYGRYGSNGILPVAFLSSSHTTGGNSGSPVLNANGELVGVNYDRMWEGVLSDYYYDEKYCRNICLDIRYALFIIDKYGNDERLIDEMKITF